MIRHLLRDDDLTAEEQAGVLDLAQHLKASPYAEKPLAGPRTVVTIYDKATLRTQTSFAVAIADLGGHPLQIDGTLARIGERESIADTARVLGPQSAAIVWRTGDQSRVEEMAQWAGVPVVNALTDQFHPCQGLADLLTIRERVGELRGRTLAFLGDTGSNMAHSSLLAGALAGMRVRLSGPPSHRPDPDVVERARQLAAGTGGVVEVLDDPVAAVRDADAVATDTWVSMGKEAEKSDRAEVFRPWQVDETLMRHAEEAVVLHCLPAYRGSEITAAVLDGPQSVVWDQAANRTHVQKAVLMQLVGEADR